MHLWLLIVSLDATFSQNKFEGNKTLDRVKLTAPIATG